MGGLDPPLALRIIPEPHPTPQSHLNLAAARGPAVLCQALALCSAFADWPPCGNRISKLHQKSETPQVN